jgi:hypothetical protein
MQAMQLLGVTLPVVHPLGKAIEIVSSVKAETDADDIQQILVEFRPIRGIDRETRLIPANMPMDIINWRL